MTEALKLQTETASDDIDEDAPLSIFSYSCWRTRAI